jgi:hypothetical protein
MKKGLEIGLAVAIVVVAASIFSPVTFLRREQYRDEVRALYESLRPGMTHEQVRYAMDSGRYPNLAFYPGDPQMWSGAAPLEFGARNWVLLIEFQGEHVSALRVRTADGIRDHPVGAPPDKVRNPGGLD